MENLWDQSEDGGKEVPQTGKNEEEIQRFTVDETISDVDRLILYLSNGQYVQQRHAIDSLPAVLKGKPKATVEATLQLLSNLLPKLDVDAQICCAEALEAAIKDKSVAVTEANELILPILLKALESKEKGQEEVEAWVAALAALCALSNRGLLGSQVLPIALAKGRVSEGPLSRATCCKILGCLAPRLAPADAEGPLLRTALELCQDTEYPVRIAMCQQLPAVSKAISRELVGAGLLDETLELLRDEEAQVRTVALAALLGVIPHLSPEVRRARVMPVLRQHMQPLELDPSMQRCVAAHFPELLAAMQPDMAPDDVGRVYGCFRRLAARQDTELRRICAQQLLAVLKAAHGTSGHAQLLDTCLELGADADQEVRRAVAGTMPQVLGQLDRNCPMLRPLQRRAIALLRDSSAEVRRELLPALPQLLPACHMREDGQPAGRDSVTLKDSPLAGEMLEALVLVDSEGGKSWRTQLCIAKAFPVMATIFPSDVIWDTFLPMALKYVSTGASAIKAAAADGIAAFFRSFRKERQRTELYCRLLREFARGRACWQRLAFVHIASAALARFSKRFFKELHLLDACLELLADSVPNVRLAAARLLPYLKLTIRLPEDVDYLERLNNIMSALMTDNDRDVSQAARTVHDAFKRTPVRMAGGAGLLDMNGAAGGGADMEAEERQRQEEEADFTMVPEELDRIRMEMGATDSKRRHARIAALVANRKPSVKGGKMVQSAAATSPLSAAGNRASTPLQGSRDEGGGASSSSSTSSSSSSSAASAGLSSITRGAKGLALQDEPGSSSSTTTTSSSAASSAATRSPTGTSAAATSGRSYGIGGRATDTSSSTSAPSLSAASHHGHSPGTSSSAGIGGFGAGRATAAMPVTSSALWSNRSRLQAGGGDGGTLGPLVRPGLGGGSSSSSTAVAHGSSSTVRSSALGLSSTARTVPSSTAGLGALSRPASLAGSGGSGGGSPSSSGGSGGTGKLPALQVSPKASGLGSGTAAGSRLGGTQGGLVSGSKLIGSGRGAGSSVLGSPSSSSSSTRRVGHGW